MEQKILALCDPEEDYVQHLSAFLQRDRELPWEVVVCTRVEELLRFAKEHAIDLLLVAESAYREEVRGIGAELTVLLNESGVIRFGNIKNIDKYQRADQVLRELLSTYMEREPLLLPRLETDRRTRLIGMYSPVRRCLQTSFALTYAQLLAEKQRVLYLNFEHYAGLEELIERQDQDLSALLYYLQTDQEKFRLRMRTLLRRKGSMDYVAPMFAGQNLLYVTAQDWRRLLLWILESGEYDHVILDLSENMQGLYEILRLCTRVYTIIQEDMVARRKVDQYEQLLSLYEFGDVLEKTRKCQLPKFRRLPEQLEQYTRSDLAEYVKGLIASEE